MIILILEITNYSSFSSEILSTESIVDEDNRDPERSTWRYIFCWKHAISVIFYASLMMRVSSFPIWLYPWLKWTFSVQNCDEAEQNVSRVMDMFGYSYYLSIFISPLPGLLIKRMQKVYKSDHVGEHHALTIIFLIIAPLTTS